jgi:predicted DNA-binding antitoxin AbrB/MazE fold protein
VSLTVEAVYADGVLKPVEPLPLKEHEKVRVSIEQGDSSLLRAYAIMGWPGDAETLERIALDPEFLAE